MSRQTWVQNAFNAGELSPFLAGRTDITKYGAGAKTIENFWIRPTGGLTRRSGTRFVLECETSSVKSRLVPFIFSATQAYVLEFGNNVIRVFKDEGNVESAPAVPLEIVTTYTEAQLPDLGFAQSNDTLYIVHTAHAPAKLTRTSHTAWTLSDIDFDDGPWMAQNTGDITLTPGGTTGAVTVTASAALFAATDVGRMLRIQSGGAADSLKDRPWAWGRITTYTNTTTVTWTIDATSSNLSAAAATLRWRFGAFGSAAAVGYPAVVTFHEQRLIFAGNPGGPQTIYASKSADFENFAITTDYDSTTTGRAVIADDNGFTYTIASNQVNVIRWMNPIRALIIGTNSGVWTMAASTPGEAITPTNVQVRRSTVTGCAAVASLNVNDEVVFVSDANNRALIVGYQFESDSYIPVDATLYAEHMGWSPFVALDYAHEPNSTVWLVREDGQLVGLTYLREQSVIGLSRHIIGGSFGAGDAVVESVAVIPAPSEDHDQVWVTVKRTIDGATVRYVEFFEEQFAESSELEDAYFVDCGLSYDGAAATAISGLDHLEGETVTVLADGGTVPDAEVVSGAITLDTAASVVHVGFAFNSNLELFRVDTEDREGTAQSKEGRSPKVILRFYRTAEGKVGQDATTLSEMDFRTTDALMDEPTPLLTGDYDYIMDAEFDKGRQVYVRQDLPLPMNLICILQYVSTGDRQ